MFWRFSVCGCTCRGAQYKFPSLWSLSTESIHAALPLFLASVGVGESIIQWEPERKILSREKSDCIGRAQVIIERPLGDFSPFTAILSFVYRSLQQQGEYKQLNMKIITLYSRSRGQLWNDVKTTWVMWLNMHIWICWVNCQWRPSNFVYNSICVHYLQTASTHEIKHCKVTRPSDMQRR